MNNRLNKHGFTLVELLVAVALIASILCMVYGSYFATSRSAQTCKGIIEASEQGRKTLEQMARQIRCSYAPADANYTEAEPVVPGSKQTIQRGMILEENVCYFNGNSASPRGEFLHFVTTNRFLGEKQAADGLFDVTYKFDKRASLLLLSQGEFTGTSQKPGERDWQTVTEGIKSLDLTFFDGDKWLRSWDFKDKKKLPSAVRIEIGCEDENNRRYHYATVADISCQKNRERTRTEKKLVSANN